MSDQTDEERIAEQTKLAALNEYLRYLYEEELERMKRLSNVGRLYFTIIAASLTIMIASARILLYQPKKIFYLELSDFHRHIVQSLFGAMVLILIVSFVFFLISLRLRRYERICEPYEFVIYSSFVNHEEVQRKVAANYVAATAACFKRNQERAKWLNRALGSYLLFVCSLFLLLMLVFPDVY